MGRYILFFHFLSISTMGLAQSSTLTNILKEKEVKTEYYEMMEAGSRVLFLPMEFAKSEFTFSQKGAIKSLKNAIVARIDLVYSDYPSKQDFTPLTKKRLESLQKLLPDIIDDPTIKFRKIRQTIGKTKDDAEILQHGFFIYFRPVPTKFSSKKEVEKLKTALEGSKDNLLDSVKFGSDSIGKVFWCWQITVSVDTTSAYIAKIPEGAIRTITRIAIKDAMAKGYIEKEYEKQYLAWGDSAYQIEDRRDEDCTAFDGSYFIYDLVDSTVSSVLNRNKWNNSLVLADVTGSMYPYTEQLLKWLKLTLTDKQKRYFVFFNDGDNKDDKVKMLGKTGGIYSIFTNAYDEVEKTIMKAMLNGGGGDAPENNIEALLESDKVCENCDSIVMIVDNWAPVKDISLLGKSHKPVKVVVCGVFDRIHKDYLKLVRETKGSLHLMEEDIFNLSEMKEGESIKIHGKMYKLVKGDFIDIESKFL